MGNYFSELNRINVNEHVEKKGDLSYLSWTWAWGEIKKAHPDAQYTIYENADGLFYHTDGRTCWVKTGVTVNGIEHIEYLPVMDNKNNSIPLDKVTSKDINKTIQRSITKACARHGLGLYIYAGEDLPDGEEETKEQKRERRAAEEKAADAINKGFNGEMDTIPLATGEQISEMRKLLKELGQDEDAFLKAMKYSCMDAIPEKTAESLTDKMRKRLGA